MTASAIAAARAVIRRLAHKVSSLQADIVNHLGSEDFTIEECCFLLKIICAKLGPNREVAKLILQEIHVDEVINTLARGETKVDILNKKVDQGNTEILRCVRVEDKGEWGTIEVFGKRLDLTKLEYIRKLVNTFTGF